MKKILAIAIAVVMTVAAFALCVNAAAEPALLITAEVLASEQNATKSGVSFELKEEGGEKFARFTAEDLDPHLFIAANNVTAVGNHYAVIKYKTTSGAKEIDAYMAGAEPHTIFSPEIENDGAWHYTYGDLEESGANWTGKFARLDPMNGGTLAVGDTIDIAWIALFANEADAKAYKGPSGSSETSVVKEKDPDFWLCKAGSTNIAPGYWMNDPYQGRNIDIKFTSTSAFNALLAQMYANAPGAEAGPCVVTIKVLDKDGKELESQDFEVSNDADGDGTKEAGDGIYTVNFKKTYEAGTYTISILPKSGQYFVLGGSEAGDGAVEVTGNFGTADQFIHEAPCAVLLGAVPGGSNPGTADAAVIAIAAVACIALAGVVVAKKIK